MESLDNDEVVLAACSEHVEKLSRRGAHIFLVCVDGSDNSDFAIEAVLNIRKKYDFICVYHCYKADAGHYEAVKEKYEKRLSRVLTDNDYVIYMENRHGKSVFNTLTSSLFRDYASNTLAQSLPFGKLPDFIVMGQHGWKPRNQATFSMGSNSDRALRNLRIPCIVVKKNIERGRQSYVMAVNESHKSRVGMDILYRIMTPRDKLVCLFVATPDCNPETIARIRDYYECDMLDFGPPDSEFIVLNSSPDRIKEAIVEYINEGDFDFFAIAPRARHTLSSLSDFLVRHSQKSIILCKI